MVTKKERKHIQSIVLRNFRAWDRQTKKMIALYDHHFNKEQHREYFKIKGCSVWLEDGVALDIFVIDKDGSLRKYKSVFLSEWKPKARR